MLICWLIVLGLGGFLFCMLICWLSFVCVDARSSDCFVDRSQPSPFTQPSPYVSTTQPTNHSTIHASTPFDHIHQIPANPGTLVQPRGRHTMHLSLWWLKPFCMGEGRPTFQPTIYSNQRSIAIIMLWPSFQPALHTPLSFHIHTCLHTYIHTYINTYIHIYIYIYILIYIPVNNTRLSRNISFIGFARTLCLSAIPTHAFYGMLGLCTFYHTKQPATKSQTCRI